MSKKVTMQTIADHLGIAKSVVSRALSDAYGISTATKIKVRNAAAEMGYVYNRKKISKSKSNNTITVFIPTDSLSDAAFCLKILSGIEAAICGHGIRMVVSALNDALVPSPQETRGIIVLFWDTPLHINRLKATGIPLVLVDFIWLTSDIEQIMADSYTGMYKATEYLIHKGHKKLIFAGHPQFAQSFRLRYHACQDCVEFYKREHVECRYVIDPTLNLPQTERTSDALLNKKLLLEILHSDYAATVIICMNDPTAFQTYTVLKEQGLRIPEDISVIGFDNIEKCFWLDPPLTTVNVPKTEMGRKAVEILLNKIDDLQDTYNITYLGVSLVERNSVKEIHN